MFDIGFWELAVLAVIGLIVLGPERLPVVARTLGRWMGQARHYMSALTSELEKEVAADDIRREVRNAREQIEAETRASRDESQAAVDSAMRPLAEDLSRDAAAAPEESSAKTTDTEAERPADPGHGGDVDNHKQSGDA
ncbi:Sec-independent protein translocase protein TatB [Salinisphaera sp. Q1T1-3]|uniref:Sec-independent protein translocase protein TatB n=1 Tax=Salinisphaera sp. Q1T1-3 TaxID=2321229 RepID=UPI000E724158|nr:Sec-independent protein translocase protein TatB [Salinisphaera sp. Q1T1-3]RJS94252.1 twin-arginine translocase subunit TatB [Salinisphaera sp. Q1T1-3]